MYRNMEDWTEIRRKVLVEGVSKRQILRDTKLHWLTLKKILEHSQPPGYRQQKPRPRKKLGAFLERIKQILKEDQAMPPSSGTRPSGFGNACGKLASRAV